MTKILAITGKLGAGKDTLADYLVRNKDVLFGRPAFAGVPPYKPSTSPRVEVYALAYKAKKFLVDCMGVSPEQVWGTTEQKNTLTKVRWEDLPHYREIVIGVYRQIAREFRQLSREITRESRVDQRPIEDAAGFINRRTAELTPRGLMTARELMEQWMEGVMRKMYAGCVHEPCLKQIAQEAPDVAIIIDLRRQMEFHPLRAAGAKVVRLTRTTPAAAANKHISNTDLDRDVFDWGLFDAVIDNQHMTVEQTQAELLFHMHRWGWVPDHVEHRTARAGGKTWTV